MAELRPLFLDTGSIRIATGSRVVDYMHFPVTASVSSSYSTILPDPYLVATMSVNITNAVNTTSSSLFELRVPNRQENYFYAHNSIVGVQTSATTTGVRIGLQTDARADAIANIKVSSTLTAHTIACIGSFSATTFALPATMAAINTTYPCFVKGLYNNSTASLPIKNVVLLQPETNNIVTANSGSVSYNKFIGYRSDLVDPGFTIGTGFNDLIQSIQIQTDGKILVGGNFTTYNDVSQNTITRLNSDGTRDTTFTIGTGADLSVTSIAIQTDGKILIGGSFSIYNGVTQRSMTRLNSDGTRDTLWNFTFATIPGFNSIVNAIAIQTDGKIMVGGGFTVYNDETRNRIIRLDSGGIRDPGFTIGTGFDNEVYSIAIQTDGKILIGGFFTSYNGTAQNRITRLNSDGTIDTSFNTGTGFDAVVYSITTQSDGKIIAVGDFTSYSGSAQNLITRLNSDGTIDTSFNTGTGFSGSFTVRALEIQTDGKILVGGYISSYNGTLQNGIIRLNSDGTRDASFNIGSGPTFLGTDGAVFSIAIEKNTKILVGGNFDTFNTTPQNNITRLLPALNINEKSIPLYLSTGSLKQISGSDTVTSSFLPPTSSLWLSQSLATSVANTSNTVYATVFTLTGLTTGKTYLAQLYMIGLSAAAGTGFRMRVINGNNYRGTLYTPTSVTAPAIQNSADGANITSIAAGAWPIGNTKYIVHGDYTFVKAATDPQVQILSETSGTAVTSVSGSVIFYRALD